MHAEIIAIGSELVLGEVIDTNSATIARKLQTIGLPLHYVSAVGDHLERIVEVVRRGLDRSHVLITTGGLGPTEDDLTRQAMAQAAGRPLIFDQGLLAQIEERFHRLSREMSGNNRRQAFRPEGSIVMENPVGTAPCFILEEEGHIAISLPGVPKEMDYLMDNAVLPFLRERFGLTGIIKSRELKVAGMGESQVDEWIGDLEKLENPTVGLNASAGFVVIRITARAAGEKEAQRLIEPVEAEVRKRLGAHIFGTDTDTLEGLVLGILSQRGEKLAAIECGLGGRLSGNWPRRIWELPPSQAGKSNHRPPRRT